MDDQECEPSDRMFRRDVLRDVGVASGLGIASLSTTPSIVSSKLRIPEDYKKLTVKGGSPNGEYELSINAHGKKCYEGENIEPSQNNQESGWQEEAKNGDIALLTGHVDRWERDTFWIPKNAEVYKIRIDGTAYVTVDPPYNDVKSGALYIEGTEGGSYTIRMNNSKKTNYCHKNSVTGSGETEDSDHPSYGFIDGELNSSTPHNDYESDSDCFQVLGAIAKASFVTDQGGAIRSMYSGARG